MIDKIKLEQYFYSYEITNINKNITLLEGSDPGNKLFLLAAHSGNSNIAFFKDLDKLNIGDEVIITYNNEIIIYNVERITKHVKYKPFFLDEKKNYLLLFTCDKHDNKYQIVLKCKKVTKNVKKYA